MTEKTAEAGWKPALQGRRKREERSGSWVGGRDRGMGEEESGELKKRAESVDPAL
jgi:hypothetical protein